MLASLGREKEGVRHFERPLESKPSLRSAAILTAIGRAHQATGNLTAARTAYNRALEIDPAHPRARQALDALGTPPPQGP
ncbi:MAG: tetratricopeptide repeat protein [Verrucomicrobiales bacterium]